MGWVGAAQAQVGRGCSLQASMLALTLTLLSTLRPTTQEGDSLQFVGLCSPTDSVFIAASNGMAQHFASAQLRQMGRTAAGVKVR